MFANYWNHFVLKTDLFTKVNNTYKYRWDIKEIKFFRAQRYNRVIYKNAFCDTRLQFNENNFYYLFYVISDIIILQKMDSVLNKGFKMKIVLWFVK